MKGKGDNITNTSQGVVGTEGIVWFCPSSRENSLTQLIRTKPNGVFCTTPHAATLSLIIKAGVNMSKVHYRGYDWIHFGTSSGIGCLHPLNGECLSLSLEKLLTAIFIQNQRMWGGYFWLHSSHKPRQQGTVSWQNETMKTNKTARMHDISSFSRDIDTYTRASLQNPTRT